MSAPSCGTLLALALPLLAGCGNAREAAPAPAARETSPATEPPTVLRGRFYSLLEHFSDANVESSSVRRSMVKSVTAGAAEQPAILAPAPARLRFPALPVHSAARLEFDYGIEESPECAGAGGSRFSVSVAVPEAGGSEEQIWEATIAENGRAWQSDQIDLARYAGQEVDLVLVTEPVEKRGCVGAAWGMPRILSSGERVELAAIPISYREFAGDLRERLDAGNADAASIDLEVELPAASMLEVAGSIRRLTVEREPLGPVQFSIEIDGDIVFERYLTSEEPGGTQFLVNVELPISIAGHRTLTFRIDDRGSRRAIARWNRASLWRAREVPRSDAAAGPNILFVAVDTLRADHLGAYGYDRDTSPRLDDFARESLVFDAAISQSSWTPPATASLLTGQYPAQHGVFRGGVWLHPRFPRLPSILQESGFTTLAISANPLVGRMSGFDIGFETFLHVPWARADGVGAAFRDWLKENRELRWFAYLHYLDPHGPYDAPAPFERKFTGSYDGPMASVQEWRRMMQRFNARPNAADIPPADVDYLRGAYDGEIRFWDHHFGRLLDLLRSEGMLDNTIIVVTSDHGEEFIEHGRFQHGQQLFEESIHVPLLIRAPTRLEPGRRTLAVETRWIPRTLLDILGLSTQENNGLPGSSLLETPPDSVFSHTTFPAPRPVQEPRTLVALRHAGWKLIFRPSDGSVALYDLESDSGEVRDVAPVHSDRVAILRAAIDDYLGSGANSEGRSEPLDPETEKRLRALGYVN